MIKSFLLKGRIAITVMLLLFAVVIISGYDQHGQHGHSSSEGKSVTVKDGDVLEIRSFGSDLSYDITKITAVAGTELTLKYINESSMPHNIILVYEESDINPVGIASIQARDTDYVPQGELDRIFGYTKIAGPNDTVKVTFTIPDPGIYPYICTYPGHFRSMQGRLHSVAE